MAAKQDVNSEDMISTTKSQSGSRTCTRSPLRMPLLPGARHCSKQRRERLGLRGGELFRFLQSQPSGLNFDRYLVQAQMVYGKAQIGISCLLALGI